MAIENKGIDMTRVTQLGFVPEKTHFVPTLQQYTAVIKYLVEEHYIKMLTDDYYIPTSYYRVSKTPKSTGRILFEEHYIWGGTEPEEIEGEQVFKELLQYFKFFDVKSNTIQKGSQGRRVYDTNKLIRVLETLCQKGYRDIRKLSITFAASPKLENLLLYGRKHFKLYPSRYWALCGDLDVHIWHGLSSKRIEPDTPWDEDTEDIDHDFLVSFTIGDVTDLYPEESEFEENADDLEENDYLIELSKDARIIKIARDLSEILAIEMIIVDHSG